MNISLEHFLVTGHLGLLYAGMSAGEVRAALGLPDNFAKTTRKYRLPNIWLYGGIEVWLDQSSPQTCHALWIECMGHGWQDEFKMPTGSTIEDWSLAPYLRREEVERYLQQNNLCYHQPEPRKAGKKCAVSALHHLIVASSHVMLGFDDQWRLCSFYSAREISISTETI